MFTFCWLFKAYYMSLFMSLRVGVLAMCALFMLSCTKSKKKEDDDTPDPSGYDRTAMLTHYADAIIIPGYTNFKVKLDSMKNKSVYFTTNPTLTTLADFRQAWVEAYTEWQKVELFDVGPASNQALRYYMNIYPTSVSKINANIVNTSSSLETTGSYDAQGFPAFDYLLNGTGATEQEILDTFTVATDASLRRDYVTRLINQMDSKFNLVYSAWTTGTYRAEFISRSSMDMSGSTSLMVNGYVLNYERYIRSGKFGIPSGAMLGGTPSPTLVEAYYKKDISLTLAKTAHQASVDFFNGKSVLTGIEGPSLKTYLDAVDAKDSSTGESLTAAINNQFATVVTMMNLLDENLSQQIVDNNQEMLDTFNELQTEVRLLKVDMTSALSITITYTDNDGD